MSQQAALLDINQIGNLMADQPEKTKDFPATVQDIRNMGVAIDANFIVIRSEMATGFAKVDSEFKSVRSEAKTESALLRSDMATDFANLDRRVSQLFKADIRWQAGFALTIIGAMITIAKFVI